MDSSPPGSSVLRILQARVLERVAIYRDINLYNQICGGLIRYVVAAEDGEDFFYLLFTYMMLSDFNPILLKIHLTFGDLNSLALQYLCLLPRSAECIFAGKFTL